MGSEMCIRDRVFTAILAVTMLKEKLRKRDVAALVCLLGGSTLVQLSEMAGAGAGKGGAEALLGGGFAVLGALLSAVPNVWYEKLLKTPGEDEWARNVQVRVLCIPRRASGRRTVRVGSTSAASRPSFSREPGTPRSAPSGSSPGSRRRS